MADLIPIIVIGLFGVGALPIWPWSKGWGWALFGMIAVAFVTLVLFRYVLVAPEA